MNYRDLADDTPEKAWTAFLLAEQEYQHDPKNQEKFVKARKAFEAYDSVRIKFNFPEVKQ